MLEYINDDLLKTHCNLIIHGCNAQRVMGSGVAKTLKYKYPEIFYEYVKKDKLELGDVIFVKTYDNKIIGNCITQKYYGYDKNKVYVSYEAIEKAIKNVNDYCVKNNIKDVAMPLIGCGLGGGNWKDVLDIIKKNANFNSYVYILERDIYDYTKNNFS